MAGRIGGPKTRNGGNWTEARFRSFIRSQLRAATMRWNPIPSALKDARMERGFYLCASCKKHVPTTLKKGPGKRIKNVHVDHIQPIVDPEKGFEDWDTLIERMFCEKENLQVLCDECHTLKTNKERAAAAKRRKDMKEES